MLDRIGLVMRAVLEAAERGETLSPGVIDALGDGDGWIGTHGGRIGLTDEGRIALGVFRTACAADASPRRALVEPS
ncbi:hypothetical protein [Coralloluteibacterium stylophorae]|uniref:Uncharacterized protein n=1 Tax=Coralloluteibacterium stylophorae TaxID=1776034 RepID=A0A8J7VR79_9GAMM|nr:hypothetical protein [Coralloluteibacterium stylophorae]MBS7455806.1 hypothetical protein [Coralloluteibacterium stylophorae]